MRRVELAAVSGEVLAICGVPGEGCGEQIVGGAVEVVPAAVIPPGRPWVGVPQGVLDVLQCGAQPEGLGGVGVPEAVRRHAIREAGGAAEPAELGVGQSVAVGTLAGAADEYAAGGPPVEVVVERPDDGRGEGDAGGLAAFAGD